MVVLLATQELLGRYGSAPRAVAWRWESAVVDVILRHGSRSDAQALLAVFLEDPEARQCLVPVFAQHGDLSMAERLLAACVRTGRLREGMPPEVLHALGFLGYEPAERMLWEHVEGPYYEAMNACLGLLHLSCRGPRTEIGQALRRHFGAGLFPEFLPVLTTKTGDPSFNPPLQSVEASPSPHSTSLPNHRGAYAGARVLSLNMPELYTDLVARLKSDTSTNDKRHCLKTFVALLDYWASRPWLGLNSAPEPTETCDALCDLLFESSAPPGATR